MATRRNNGGGGGNSSALDLVSFDGSAVWGRWGGGNAATPFVFALFEDGQELQRTDVQYGAQSVGPFSARIEVGPWLDPAKAYTVGVSRGNGPESFEGLTEVIVEAPVLASVDYDGTRILVTAAAPSNAEHVLVATLWTNERELVRIAGSATQVTIPISTPLEGWRQPYLRLHHQSSYSIGRMGEAIALVVDAPVITQTEYDGQTVGVRWRDPIGGPAPAGGRLVLAADGAKVAEATASGDRGTIAATGLDPAKRYSVSVRSTRGPIVGPVSAAASVISARPKLDSVSCDGATVIAAFSGKPDAAMDRFVLELSSDAVTLARVPVGATGGVVPGPFDPARRYSLAVRALGEGRSGPLGEVAGVVSSTPQIGSIASSATQNPTITVELAQASPAPNWVTRWRASLWHDDALLTTVESAEPKLVFGQLGAIDPAGAYSLRLQALGNAGASLFGPVSAALPVVVHAAEITRASWDGQRVEVSWRPLAQAGLRGYTVTLHASDGSQTTAPIVTADTRASLEFSTPTAGVVYTVAVVAHTDHAVGPAQAAPAIVALRPRPAAWFVGAGSDGATRVFRGDLRTTAAAASGSITLMLPRLFSAPPAAWPQNEGFAIAPSGDAKRPYKLTVNLAATGIGSANATERLAARDKFIRFVAALEQSKDAQGKPVLQLGAVALLGQVVARGLPLSFADTLYYAYGLDQRRRAVDLLPGMRLRVDASAYQLVPPDSSVTSTLSGHVARGSIYYEISAGGEADGQLSARTGVDAFLSRVIGIEIPPALSQEGEGQDTGLDGSVDLLQTSLRRPWLRLVYPTRFVASNAKGSIGTEAQVALVAADTREALEAASKAVSETGTFTSSLTATATFLRGRAALIPEILVSLDRHPLHVALGTTVRQLLARAYVVPLRSDAGVDLDGITMTRCLGGVVELADDLADGESFDRREPVLLGRAQASNPNGDGLDRFDLPLLHGDAVSTRGP